MATGIAAQNFLATDLSSIAISTTLVEGTGFDSLVIPVYAYETILLQGKATGDAAACALTVDLVFVASLDGIIFDTEAYATLYLTLNGTTPIIYSAQLPVTGIHSLKLLSIKNNESVGGRTASSINVKLGATTPLRP